MSEPLKFAKEASERIVTSLSRNNFFTYGWKQIDKGIGKEFFESLFADIITKAWNRRTDIDNTITKNEPLTLEELRQMDGEPVYLVMPHVSCWAVIMEFSSNGGALRFNSGQNDLLVCDYGKTWIAYRRKPEMEAEA